MNFVCESWLVSRSARHVAALRVRPVTGLPTSALPFWAPSTRLGPIYPSPAPACAKTHHDMRDPNGTACRIVRPVRQRHPLGPSSRRVLGRVRTRTVPGRLAGKTKAFGALNRGSSPRPGAAKAVRYLTILSSAAAHDLFGPALDLVVKVTTAADVDAETAVIGLPHVLPHGLRVVTLQRWGQELFGLRAGDF